MDNRGTGVQSPAERDEIFLFSETTRRVLMAGGGGRVEGQDYHSPPSSNVVKEGGAVPQLSYFVTRYLNKNRDRFSLT